MRARSGTTTPEGQTPAPRFATPAPSTSSLPSPPPLTPEPTPPPWPHTASQLAGPSTSSRSASVPTLHFVNRISQGTTILTRSASRASQAGGRPGFANAAPVVTSTSGSAASTTAASTASTSISVASTTVTQKAKNNRHDPPEDFDEDGSRTIRARLGCHPNRHEMKTGQRSETAWFPSKADFVLSAPPAWVSKRSDLVLGDLFCHWTPTSNEPQMWIWVAEANGPAWKSVTKGYVRPHDQRQLTINAQNEPQFLTDGWNRKKVRKHAAAAAAAVAATRKRERRDKGKQRAKQEDVV
ncbi:hypothetical protein L227DRAFT_618126 [Lentinus tigrinus ALCF2SS1-6]|uniref:Uncharacterized protein n=1 Tax=Lentinus tigrinus ALCF2SS1-6 TaxID=1328759 RepID=A0A5C2RPD3_9APHY|nr:hypothetical protein L227DRAFT_618126 [Lentinus tigrinus ALCF2SS1-6]